MAKRNATYTSPSDLFDKFNLDVHKKNILIRLEETKASYIADKNLKNRIFMIDSLVNSLWQSTNLIILCRYEDQIFEISKRYEGKAHVVKSITDGTALILMSDLFIGAGGTMTAEASLPESLLFLSLLSISMLKNILLLQDLLKGLLVLETLFD